MYTQTTINWTQAERIQEIAQVKKDAQYLEALEDVKTSDFSMLSFMDVAHYAEILGITANEVRELNMKHTGSSKYDMIDSFLESDTDDFIDFY